MREREEERVSVLTSRTAVLLLLLWLEESDLLRPELPRCTQDTQRFVSWFMMSKLKHSDDRGEYSKAYDKYVAIETRKTIFKLQQKVKSNNKILGERNKKKVRITPAQPCRACV